MPSTMTRFESLLRAIEQRQVLVRDYLARPEYADRFRPQHLHDAVYSYIRQGGKSLRPAVLLLSCGAVGGDESLALPAAAAVEVYHTWTLVHDDIIDKDDRRRGAPTVHTEFAARAASDLGWEGDEARHYGLSIGILAGDLQQSWSWALLFELFTRGGVDPGLVVALAHELATRVTPILVEGETLDVQYSRNPDRRLTEDEILAMLWKKTGVLYEFAGRAGASIGLGRFDPAEPAIRAIATFCSRCGTAFQIQDDVLGIMGDEARLGKPVGSDIREGKRTLITLKALESASPDEERLLRGTLGNPHASAEEIGRVVDLARELGAIDYAQGLAQRYIDEALDNLQVVPESEHRQLLQLWAEYLIARQF